MGLKEEILRRRTFAIISHPDAGKTTLTEKLLLFGGAIHVAGAVKSNKIRKTATSDFMEIERQRGISVATSVMGFEYGGIKVNILDTPGHEDFAEDTYRTLTAVDSVIIVIDGAKGVETQTRKLMNVCRMRKTPVMVFVNKLDRPCRDPFDLLDEIETELKIAVRPLSFPVSSGPAFKGVYNIYDGSFSAFTSNDRQTVSEAVKLSLDSPQLDEYIRPYTRKLRDDLSLVEGVYEPFERELYLAGELAPVFFGSAINNFGVKELLETFIEIAPSPRRDANGGADRAQDDRFRVQDTRQHGPEPPRPYRFPEDMFRDVRAQQELLPCTQRQADEILFAQCFHGRKEIHRRFRLSGRYRGIARYG